MYTYIHIYIYIYIYICMYVCIYICRCMYVCMYLFFFNVLQIFVMDPPRRAGAAGGTVKPWPGGSRGLPGPRPPRHLEWMPAAAAPAGAVAAAGGRSVVPTSHRAPTKEARCVPATCVRLAYTVSCIVPEGAKGTGGRGRQGGGGGTKAAGGCSAMCVPQAQGPGHQGAAR